MTFSRGTSLEGRTGRREEGRAQKKEDPGYAAGGESKSAGLLSSRDGEYAGPTSSRRKRFSWGGAEGRPASALTKDTSNDEA